MPNAVISGTGFYVPPRVVTNDALKDEYGIDTTHEWIESRSGIVERRYAGEGVTTSDMAHEASVQAIAAAGIAPTALDMIIFATLSPDRCFPGSGVYLQRRLGLADGDDATFVPALDIRNQCSGFVYGLSVAASMVRAGTARNVLLVGAELHSHGLDRTTRGRSVAALFGDGAGAVIVSASDEDRGVRGWHLGADGRHADVLSQRIWDVTRDPIIPLDDEGNGRVSPEMLYPQMDGKRVFKHSVHRMSEALKRLFATYGTSVDDVDLFLFHQANLRANEWVQKLLGIPDVKVFHNIMRYGNTTAATIPILMAEAERNGRLKRGMRVATAVFGSGFTWGSALIDW